MDQPWFAVLYMEKVLDAQAALEEKEAERDKARTRIHGSK